MWERESHKARVIQCWLCNFKMKYFKTPFPVGTCELFVLLELMQSELSAVFSGVLLALAPPLGGGKGCRMKRRLTIQTRASRTIDHFYHWNNQFYVASGLFGLCGSYKTKWATFVIYYLFGSVCQLAQAQLKLEPVSVNCCYLFCFLCQTATNRKPNVIWSMQLFQCLAPVACFPALATNYICFFSQFWLVDNTIIAFVSLHL